MDPLSPSSDVLTDSPNPKPSTDTPPASSKSPWFSIWFHPRQTIERIIWNDPKQQVIILAVLAGIVQAFDSTKRYDVGIVSGLLVMILTGSISGLIFVYFGGWILRITAMLLGGTASPEESRAALAWSNVPQITLLVLAFLPMLFLYGPETFHLIYPIFDAKTATDVTFRLMSELVILASGLVSIVTVSYTHLTLPTSDLV